MKGRKLKMSEIIEKSYKCEPIYIKSNQADREILVDISPKSLIDLIGLEKIVQKNGIIGCMNAA